MKRMFALALAASALATAAGGAHAADLVTNGGFETGDFTGWTQGGNTSFTSVGSAPTNYVALSGDSLGSYSAYLGPIGTSGSLSQLLSTVVGDTYTVSFDLSNEGQKPNQFSASVTPVQTGSGTIVDIGDEKPFVIPGGDLLFEQYSYTFVATSAATNLQFNFFQSPSYWVLDNVQVDGTLGTGGNNGGAVPEPATWALMLVGFGMIGFAMRQRLGDRRAVSFS